MMTYWKEADFRKYREPAQYRRDHKCSNLIAGFDTETTQVNGKDPIAFMYEWTFGVEDTIVYGRTWDELREFLLNLRADLCLHSDYKLIVFDQRLKFEFQFFKRELWISEDPKEFISRDARNILRCVVNDVFEFRSSDEFSERSLDAMGALLGIPKIKGFDYSIPRLPSTPLDDFELSYFERDVRILLEYFKKARDERYKIAWKIPLTATREIKNLIYKNFAVMGNGVLTYANQFRDKPEDREKLEKLQDAFFGSWNFSSLVHDEETIENVTGVDRSSDYAAHMLLERYPVKKFKKVQPPDDWRELLSLRYRNTAYFVTLSLKNLENIYPGIGFLPENKRWKYQPERCEILHDRILKAKDIILTLTDIDFKLLCEFYAFDEDAVIVEMYAAKYGYLPPYVVKTVYDLYVQKAEAKEVISAIKKERLPTLQEEDEYTIAKTRVSRIYGIFVQNPLMLVYSWDAKKNKCVVAVDEDDNPIEEYVKGDRDPVLYQWGVWVTAYARRAELTVFKEMDLYINDYGEPRSRDTVLYGDTDSLKYTGDHTSIIIAYNEEVKRKISRFVRMNRCLFDFSEEKLQGLGIWDFEHYRKFRTIGVKKYGYIDDRGNFVAKFSGLCRENEYFSRFETADEKLEAILYDMEIPAEFSANKTLTYNDDAIEAVVQDRDGREERILSKSCLFIGRAKYESKRGGSRLGQYGDLKIVKNRLRRKK